MPEEAAAAEPNEEAPATADPSDDANRGGMAVIVSGSKLFYTGAAALLMGLSLTLLAIAAWQLGSAMLGRRDLLHYVLESISLVTIAIAVYEVARFLIEEELIRERQLRSVLEARRSLTKFFTIVIIVISLEAIVLVFETKFERMAELIYPTGLMAVAVAAMIGLGLFQWLTAEGGSNRIGDDARQMKKRP